LTLFGKTAAGEDVHKIILSAGDLTVSLLTLGAIVQDVRLAGVGYSLTLGSETVADYQGRMRHHGSLIGPMVNRLSRASAPIGGKVHRFEANQDGRHTLHSGAAGTHLKVWTLDDLGKNHASLGLVLPDGEGGFPGHRRVVARFTLAAPAMLTLTVRVTTDAPTLVNFANHSYWNLDGSRCWDGHQLRVAADRYLPTTDAFVPTGEIADVAGTPMDLRDMRPISVGNPLFDNNFCLSETPQPLRDVLWLRGRSGVNMTVATTRTGIQVYDGRDAVRPGRAVHEGLAIEAQDWPDAPNHRGFPSVELHPDDTYQSVTRWRFARD
jgi:aldose 1-epimerase